MSYICDNPLCADHVPMPPRISLLAGVVHISTPRHRNVRRTRHEVNPRIFSYLCDVCERAVSMAAEIARVRAVVDASDLSRPAPPGGDGFVRVRSMDDVDRATMREAAGHLELPGFVVSHEVYESVFPRNAVFGRPPHARYRYALLAGKPLRVEAE